MERVVKGRSQDLACVSGIAESPRPPRRCASLQQAVLAPMVTRCISSASFTRSDAVGRSVDGETKITLYRHGFTAEDATHVWSAEATRI